MADNASLENKKIEKTKMNFKDSKYATGRRKKSIAKIWIKSGSWKIYLIDKDITDFFY